MIAPAWVARFADYLSIVPGCMISLVVRPPGGKVTPLHTNAFRIDEKALLAGLLTRRGPYLHSLKNLVIGPDNRLYVDIASSTNADPIDTTGNPVRSGIYQYDLDGSNGRIFARGIRNAEGLGFVPGTNEL